MREKRESYGTRRSAIKKIGRVRSQEVGLERHDHSGTADKTTFNLYETPEGDKLEESQKSWAQIKKQCKKV